MGIHDDFFELGGHSLMATQIITRVRRTFRVELPLRALFEEPTVARLAAAIAKAREGARPSAVAPPLVPVKRRDLPLSFAQQRLWFLDQLEPANAAYNVPAAFRLEGHLDAAVLEACFREIARRHQTLRTRFPSVDGRPRQLIASELTLHLPLVDLGRLPDAPRHSESRRLILREAWRPFDLERGPVFRILLLRRRPGEHVLLVNAHHIVSDGWSLGVFSRELTRLYEAFAAGRPSPLAELVVQYADFAVWQRRWLRGEVLEGQLGYWRAQLGGDLPLLQL
ncbi:MAG: non-ribosomal peptide synthetase, partial [bacterium]|nr:non-ribosomal peptide synthetase [bacterium]